jgi:hypothetical protein
LDRGCHEQGKQGGGGEIGEAWREANGDQRRDAGQQEGGNGDPGPQRLARDQARPVAELEEDDEQVELGRRNLDRARPNAPKMVAKLTNAQAKRRSSTRAPAASRSSRNARLRSRRTIDTWIARATSRDR